MESGTVLWITGLAGAGKTTIGKRLYELMKQNNRNVVFLDGDLLREVLGNSDNYTLSEREKLAFIYSRLCKMLSDQGLDVICCTISMFPSVWDWNRKNIKSYKKVYLKTSLDILKKRDQKGLYSKAESGTCHNVLGVDVDYTEPISPDIVIVNDGDETSENIAQKIYNKLVL